MRIGLQKRLWRHGSSTKKQTTSHALGMYWCAIDWRKTNKDTYFFLEANPSLFYLKVERDTGLDITGKLLNLLTM